MRRGPWSSSSPRPSAPGAAAETWDRARIAAGRGASPTARAALCAGGAAEHVETFDRVLPLGASRPARRVPRRRRAPWSCLAGRAVLRGFRAPRRSRSRSSVDGVILGGGDRTFSPWTWARTDDPFEPLAHEYTHFALNPVLAAQPPWLARAWRSCSPARSRAGNGDPRADVGRAYLRRGSAAAHAASPTLLAVGYRLRVPGRRRPGTTRRSSTRNRGPSLHWIVAGGHGGMAGRARLRGRHRRRRGPRVRVRALLRDDRRRRGRVARRLLGTRPLPIVAVPLAAPLDRRRSKPLPPWTRPTSPAISAELLLRGGRTADARSAFRRALGDAPASAAGTRAWPPSPCAKAGSTTRGGTSRPRWPPRPTTPARCSGAPSYLVRAAAARGDVLSEAETGRAVALLDRALDADPDLADAADLLARLRPAPLPHRIALLRRAVARQPERAELAFTLAGLHIKRNELAEAARVLRRARERTRDDAHRFLGGHLLTWIAPWHPAGEARGMLEPVECLAGARWCFACAPRRPPAPLRGFPPLAVPLRRRRGHRGARHHLRARGAAGDGAVPGGTARGRDPPAAVAVVRRRAVTATRTSALAVASWPPR